MFMSIKNMNLMSNLRLESRISPIIYFTQIPVTFPTTAPEIQLPELEGKTAKMYRYGQHGST